MYEGPRPLPAGAIAPAHNRVRLDGPMSSAADRPFTGVALDRAESLRKDPDAVRRLIADPRARAVVG